MWCLQDCRDAHYLPFHAKRSSFSALPPTLLTIAMVITTIIVIIPITYVCNMIVIIDDSCIYSILVLFSDIAICLQIIHMLHSYSIII